LFDGSDVGPFDGCKDGLNEGFEMGKLVGLPEGRECGFFEG
jgi:hypothetical protein